MMIRGGLAPNRSGSSLITSSGRRPAAARLACVPTPPRCTGASPSSRRLVQARLEKSSGSEKDSPSRSTARSSSQRSVRTQVRARTQRSHWVVGSAQGTPSAWDSGHDGHSASSTARSIRRRSSSWEVCQRRVRSWVSRSTSWLNWSGMGSRDSGPRTMAMTLSLLRSARSRTRGPPLIVRRVGRRSHRERSARSSLITSSGRRPAAALLGGVPAPPRCTGASPSSRRLAQARLARPWAHERGYETTSTTSA